MKVLKTSVIGAILTLCMLHASAQRTVSIHEHQVPVTEPNYNKPRLFNDLPQKMKLRTSDLQGLLNLSVGASVKTFIADNFLFKGIVVSTGSSETMRSVVVRSTDRLGATLTFTETINNGTYKYLGRIMSLENGDAFDIVKENDQYILQKKNLYDLISE